MNEWMDDNRSDTCRYTLGTCNALSVGTFPVHAICLFRWCNWLEKDIKILQPYQSSL